MIFATFYWDAENVGTAEFSYGAMPRVGEAWGCPDGRFGCVNAVVWRDKATVQIMLVEGDDELNTWCDFAQAKERKP